MNNNKLVIGITAPQSTMLLKGQLSYFRSIGYDVYLLAPKENQTIKICMEEGATLLPISIRRKISPIHDLRSLIQIFTIFWKIKPDIVNLGTPKISLLGMCVAKLLGVKKRIYTCRGFRFEHERGLFKWILMVFEKITSAGAHRVLCISQSVRDLGIGYRIFSEDKSVVINKGSSNGIDLRLYNLKVLDKTKTEILRQKYNPSKNFIFGFVGRIIDRKGFKELLDAFDKIYEKDKNVKLLIVGRPYYDQMDKTTIKRAKTHSGVEMVGLVDYEETPYYYNLMDVFVLPSYWEGFGNVLIQAAALGIPIITTNVTGCKDAVSHNYNATLIEAKNVTQLYNAMLEFQQSRDLLMRYSQNGLEWVKNFKSETIWQGINKLYIAG